MLKGEDALMYVYKKRGIPVLLYKNDTRFILFYKFSKVSSVS